MAEGWYELSASYQTAGVDLFDYAIFLKAWGPSGNGSLVLIATMNGQTSNSAVFQAPEIYFGLLGFSGELGIQTFDNISISIPEPSSLALFGLGSLILGAQWIRRAKVKT